jgi:gliding motility associated protien GldN
MNIYNKKVKLVFVSLLLFMVSTLNAQKPTPPIPKDTLLKKVEVSLVPIDGFGWDTLQRLQENNTQNLRIPPKVPEIRKEDVLFTETVWEDIDAREKKNRLFLNAAKSGQGYQNFFKILLTIIESDTQNVKMYDARDDRFTNYYSLNQLYSAVKGDWQLVDETDSTGKKTGNKQWERNPDKNSIGNMDSAIYTFRIKAQYIYDNRTSRMHYRIIGICPVATLKQTINSRDTIVKKPLFWLYYPGPLRNYLANNVVYNPNNQKDQNSWVELLEARYFDRVLTKTSNKNPNDKDLFELYKDPKKRLEAAEKIRQRIDDYDQDRWVY